MCGHIAIITETESTLWIDDVGVVPGLLPHLREVQSSCMHSRKPSGRQPGKEARFLADAAGEGQQNFPDLQVQKFNGWSCGLSPIQYKVTALLRVHRYLKCHSPSASSYCLCDFIPTMNAPRTPCFLIQGLCCSITWYNLPGPPPPCFVLTVKVGIVMAWHNALCS